MPRGLKETYRSPTITLFSYVGPMNVSFTIALTFSKVSELHQIYEAKKEGCELLYRYKRAKRAVNYDLAGAGSGHMDCCPLVIDPLTLTALLAFIAAATYFLWGWNMTLLTFMSSNKHRKFCRDCCYKTQ